MILNVEKWAESQPLTSDARSMIAESALCYKVGAYRAALIFSYLALQTIVRERLQASIKPSDVPENVWKKIQEGIRDENSWDPTVFDALRRGPPTDAFDISEDLRRQIEYWRDRRNDCAHSKANAIGSAHVEAHWLFLRSNAARLVVKGSRQGLLDRVERFLDPTYTSPGSDPTVLLGDISRTISPKELGDFCSEARRRLQRKIGKIVVIDESAYVFIELLLEHGTAEMQAAAVTYVSSEEEFAVEVLRRSPKLLARFATSSMLLRRIRTAYLFRRDERDLALYASFLRNGLIPEDEKAALSTKAVRGLHGAIPEGPDLEALLASGFFTEFEKLVFGEKRLLNLFDWANRNSALIGWYVQQFPLSEMTVEGICEVFQSGRSFPFETRKTLDILFGEMPKKRKEFRKIAKNAGFALPDRIESLVESRAQ